MTPEAAGHRRQPGGRRHARAAARRCGHPVRTAYDGPSGIATARTLLPHAVFCDIGMPGMNGHEVATTLRNGVPPTAALIAVTGWGADEDRRKAQDAGFDFHLVKPVDSRAIDAVLEKPRHAADGVSAPQVAGCRRRSSFARPLAWVTSPESYIPARLRWIWRTCWQRRAR